MKIFKNVLLIALSFIGLASFSQETLPIYSDYLSDNVYLVHPAAAGIGNCGKARLTARTQWAGVEDAPALQTLSVHNRIGDNMGFGGILFNDRNGYHSQTGVNLTYAYHINLSRPEDANQLSFGLSAVMLESRIDETSFYIIQDPIITNINQSKFYFNTDFSMAYHLQGLFSYFTIKNLLSTPRNLYNDRFENNNIRRYLATVGYYFGDEDSAIEVEPSIMAQYIETTEEKFVDFNIKVYKTLDNAKLWMAFSYRQGFDSDPVENLQYITPVVGINYNNFLFSYTYTKQSGDILFDSAGYHQLTLGMNFGCRQPRLNGCPNIKGSF